MNRVPLILRTAKSNAQLKDLKPSIAKGFGLGFSSDVTSICEINLRSIFAESFGNPLKKIEQRDKLHGLIKDALTNQKIIILNFDDAYPESVHEQLAKTYQNDKNEKQSASSMAYDANIKEFSGTQAIPSQLWAPLDIG